MLVSHKIIAYYISTEPDPSRSNLAGTCLAAAGKRIRSLAIVTLNIFQCGDSEVLIQYITADDDAEERDLLRTLQIDSDDVTIVCCDPAIMRTTMRLRTMVLLDDQDGGAEALHLRLSAARWTAPRKRVGPTSFVITASWKEGQCWHAASLLLHELAGSVIMPLGKQRFEKAVALLNASAQAVGLQALAAKIPIMRLAAL